MLKNVRKPKKENEFYKIKKSPSRNKKKIKK